MFCRFKHAIWLHAKLHPCFDEPNCIFVDPHFWLEEAAAPTLIRTATLPTCESLWLRFTILISGLAKLCLCTSWLKLRVQTLRLRAQGG